MALDLCWDTTHANTSLIGSGRKGRRKGSKNRSFVQRIDEREEKNEIKRRNERQRVKNISYQYNRLRKALGDPHPEKKLRKQQVLNSCIAYIQELQQILKNSDPGGSSDGGSEVGGTSGSCSYAGGGDGGTRSSCSESLNSSSSCSPPPGIYSADLKCNESFNSFTPPDFMTSPTPPPSSLDLCPLSQPQPGPPLGNAHNMAVTPIFPIACHAPVYHTHQHYNIGGTCSPEEMTSGPSPHCPIIFTANGMQYHDHYHQQPAYFGNWEIELFDQSSSFPTPPPLHHLC